MKTLGNNKSATFNEFMSDALTQENNNTIYAASKNCKRAFEASASQAKAPVAVRNQFCPPTAATWYRPPQKKNQAKTGFRKAFTVPLPKDTKGPGNSYVLPC